MEVQKADDAVDPGRQFVTENKPKTKTAVKISNLYFRCLDITT